MLHDGLLALSVAVRDHGQSLPLRPTERGSFWRQERGDRAGSLARRAGQIFTTTAPRINNQLLFLFSATIPAVAN
jgi:hypothetical protein